VFAQHDRPGEQAKNRQAKHDDLIHGVAPLKNIDDVGRR